MSNSILRALILMHCTVSAAYAIAPANRHAAANVRRPELSKLPRALLLEQNGHRTVEPTLMAAASKPSGSATVSASIVNLAKNIVGSGVLALAAGVAAFTASPLGILPASLILLSLGALSGYTFSLIARVGDEVGADTYRDTWAKIFGEGTSLLPALTVAFKTYVGGLAYSIILGDLFASVAKLAGLPALLQASNTWILGLSAFVLLPLALMRDLSSLAIGSVIGTAGTLYTALFIWLRKLDGTYAVGSSHAPSRTYSQMAPKCFHERSTT